MAYVNGSKKIGDRVLTLENAFTTLSGDIAGLEARMNGSFTELKGLFTHISDEKSSSKRFTINLFVAAGPIIVACFVGLWFVMTLQINALNAPMNANMASLATTANASVVTMRQNSDDITTLKTLAAASTTERQYLTDNIRDLQKQVVEMDKATAANQAFHNAKEIEIETQFNLDAQLRNIQFSEQQRLNALMWNAHKTLGVYPTAPFYQPNVSQHDGRAIQMQ